MTSPVFLRIYHLINAFDNGILHFFGLGLWHSSIVVDELEIEFDSAKGISCFPEGTSERQYYSNRIFLGYLKDEQSLQEILTRLNSDKRWRGSSYCLIYNNCNDFTQTFAANFVGGEIPHYLNRMARWGMKIPCIIINPKDNS